MTPRHNLAAQVAELGADSLLPEAKAKPWRGPFGPEDRLSIVVSMFLDDTLEPPFYVSAETDADKGGRNENQRARDKRRGVRPGRLDWDICQGHAVEDADGHRWMQPLCRKLELKRGKNDLSDNQKVTVAKLSACGADPVTAWTLREVYLRLWGQGFRFRGNVETLLQKYEAQLDALDRDAELRLAGAKKPSARKKSAGPRYAAGKSFVRRAAKAGVRI